ncbi:hypothetical protein ILYODFUR_038380, partial [Ilyodon furcidens]
SCLKDEEKETEALKRRINEVEGELQMTRYALKQKDREAEALQQRSSLKDKEKETEELKQ